MFLAYHLNNKFDNINFFRFAYVDLSDPNDTDKILALDGTEFMDNALKIEKAKQRLSQTPTPRPVKQGGSDSEYTVYLGFKPSNHELCVPHFLLENVLVCLQ